MKLSKQGYEALQNEMQHIFKSLFDLRKDSPETDEVQQHIAQHYEVIRKFWGTSNSADKQILTYTGLGDLYVSEDSYLANVTDGNPQPEFARFLQKAIKHFADNKLG